MQIPNKKYSWFIVGFLFAALWASASAATKIGLNAAQPLVIANTRFFIASVIMLSVAHLFMRLRLPKGKEWKQLTIYGLLNISIYLGCYVVAMQTVTAGVSSLSIATNPVLISFMSVFFLKKKLNPSIILALIICSIGVVCAAWPLFSEASVTASGLLILFFSMLSYSIGAIYFSTKNWNELHLLTINGWQTILGGLFLLPVTFFFFKDPANHFNSVFWQTVLWLAIPVSIFAVQLWLWLLKTNPVRAGLWLFLCPLFGYIYAAWLLHDKISNYTIAGVILVIIGLMISRRNIKKDEVVFD